MDIILNVIDNVLSKKKTDKFVKFLNGLGNNHKEWYLIRDYCLDDKNKLNDAFTFSLFLSNAKLDDIKNLIQTVSKRFKKIKQN